MGYICILLIFLLCIISFGCCYHQKKTYRTLNQMLEDILNQRPITQSDVVEGGLSNLASKAKRIQEKLEQEISQAQKEKEQVKSLISNMSHQLKTPLTNVMMYEEILESQGIDEEKRQAFLKKMREQSEKIEWILQSLFKMVKLEQGTIVFEPQPVSVKETIVKAVSAIYNKAQKKQIAIEMKPFSDCMLYHNSKWTVEVFENILENAVKYTDSNGKITISVEQYEMYTKINFQDTGIGIRQEELIQIFHRFYRSKDVENVEGSGIGLYLSKMILEREKGYMTVASEYGKETCFSVFLQNCKK